MPMAPLIGIVEGFDWPSAAALDGQWGELRPEERIYLLASMQTWGYDTYLYDPRALRERNADPVRMLRDPGHWPATFDAARDHGVNFVWGLVPDAADSGGLMDRVERLVDLGADGVALLFGEAVADDPEKQVRAQGYLARNIEARFPGVVKAFRSGCWHPGDEGAGTIPELLDAELPRSIALIWSGGFDASVVRRVGLPELERRDVWVWDRALDPQASGADRLRFEPLDGRCSEDLADLGGWLIELPYPLDLALPSVAGSGVLATGDPSSADQAMVKAWSRWFHDVGEDALGMLLDVLRGRAGAETLTEHARIALRSKPGLRSLVDDLVDPPPSLA